MRGRVGASDAALRRLAERIVDARVRAGYTTQEDLAMAAGVSKRTVSNAEAAVALDRVTYPKLEQALGWPRGTALGELRRDVVVVDLSDPQSRVAVLASVLEQLTPTELAAVLAAAQEVVPPPVA